MKNKYKQIEIIYSSKKFSTLRGKILKDATPKQMGTAIAKLMSKGYEIKYVNVNGIRLEDYVKYYGLA